MKAAILKVALGATVLSLSQVGVAQTKSFAGGVSNDAYIEVGESVIDAGPHQSGLAGIGIGAGGMTKDQVVDISFLNSFASPIAGTDVLVLNMAGDSDVDEPDHSGLGVFSFVQVGDEDIWVGEWSWAGDPDFQHRSVFYIGDNTDVSMPTSGQATYAVNGLNHFAVAGDLLSGSLTAHFGNGGSLEGHLDNGTLGIVIDAQISGSSFTGNAGSAIAYDAANYNYDDVAGRLDTNGLAKGEFYGADAAFLAGMATFINNSQYDTSFGGERGAITP